MARQSELSKLVQDSLWGAMDQHFQLKEIAQSVLEKMPIGMVPRNHRQRIDEYVLNAVRRIASTEKDSFGNRRWVSIPAGGDQPIASQTRWWRRLGSLSMDELDLLIKYRGSQINSLTAKRDELLTIYQVLKNERRKGRVVNVDKAFGLIHQP